MLARTTLLKEAVVTFLEKSNWSDVVEFYFNDISEKKAGSLQKVVTESDSDKRRRYSTKIPSEMRVAPLHNPFDP